MSPSRTLNDTSLNASTTPNRFVIFRFQQNFIHQYPAFRDCSYEILFANDLNKNLPALGTVKFTKEYFLSAAPDKIAILNRERPHDYL